MDNEINNHPVEVSHESGRSLSPVLIGIGAVLLLAIGIGAGWYISSRPTTPPQTTPPAVVEEQEQVEEEKKSDEEKKPDEQKPEDPDTANNSLVAWQNPLPIRTSQLLSEDQYSDLVTLKVGTFTSGQYEGDALLLVYGSPNTMSFNDDFFHFVEHKNLRNNFPYTLLIKESSPVFEGDDYMPIQERTPRKIIYAEDNTTTFPELSFPKTIKGSSGQVLELADDTWEIFDISKYEFLFKEPTWGNVYVDKVSNTDDARVDDGFYLKAPNGTRRVYFITPPFIGKNKVANVTWNDGTKNLNEYTYTRVTGCGSMGYAAVIRNEFPETDLAASGKTVNGDPVLEFKKADHPYLQSIYDEDYWVYGDDKKKPYTDFVKEHPVFFWKDSFGRIIRFQNNEFIPPGECGKPVIYLYPENTTDVSVKLYPQGGFSVTEPEYNDGWNVTAFPNGAIVDKSSGLSWPYLFWEGTGGQYEKPTKGFVVAQKDVHDFLVSTLAKLGLNKQETYDFVTFWEPRMQGSPYYFVGFYGNRVMNELAPLDVTPKPDTVIRILMDYTPLEKPIKVEPQEIRTPARNGFILVEWGGVIRGK